MLGRPSESRLHSYLLKFYLFSARQGNGNCILVIISTVKPSYVAKSLGKISGIGWTVSFGRERELLTALQTIPYTFTDTSFLGSGGYGSVVKAKMPSGQEVAIKKAPLTGQSVPLPCHLAAKPCDPPTPPS